ncbi:MAG: DEAD/DEAH box helicase, partial [Bacteroidota bacterium]
LSDKGAVKTFMKKEDDNFNFYRIKRAKEEESKIFGFLEDLRPNPHSLTPWELIDKETGLSWLSNHTQDVREKGIEIIQENKSNRLRLVRPELSLNTEEQGDWFDIKAVVRIGAFEIPFIKFRNHILKGKREFILPDGTIAILPEEWFSDYRHLLEVSEVNEGSETLSIKKYQAPLLNFPSREGQGRKQLLETMASLERIPTVPPSANLKATLRNYQQEGLNWLNFMKEHHMGGILADDMGLGKTLQTLSLLQREYQEEGNPSLIVLPTSLIHNWQNEARKFTPDLSIFIHTGINRPKDPQIFSAYNLILTTYGIVRQDIKMLKDYPFKFVILDESQNIKNPESKTAKAIRKLVSEYRLSLTGTPIENTVMDIWSQMAFLNPGLLGSESFFKKFYVSPIEKENDPKRSAKLRRIIYPYILRRKKQQVEKDLPPRIEKLHYCEMTETQESWYQETRSQYRNYLMELISQGAWKKNKLNILTGLQKLRQIAIHPQMIDKEAYKLEDSGKYIEVKRLLKQVISKKRSKVLIFSQFVKMLHLLRDDLKEEGITYNYLDGSTKNRQEQVDTFQNDPSIQVFLISLKAGGVGLNLTAADYVFILDPWWNPAAENQAIDRSHRIGQKRTVFYYKFITEGTIEEKILNLQQRKAQLSDDIISVEEDIYKSLNAGDLEALLV